MTIEQKEAIGLALSVAGFLMQLAGLKLASYPAASDRKNVCRDAQN
jgi:hypothetical protein